MAIRNYIGQELSLFAEARTWKSYVRRLLASYITGRVIEVGGGCGATTQALAQLPHQSWYVLEPDPTLFDALTAKCSAGHLPKTVIPIKGTLEEFPPGAYADSILYIDVLEHIEDDRDELNRASLLLNPGGYLIVLAPAYATLYSPFDKAIGHYRRYTLGALKKIDTPTLEFHKGFYLDSIGAALSFANRVMLHQNMPTARQIKFWDKFIIPISIVADGLVNYSFGRSVVVVWKRR